jgi:hypothetical protein
LLIRTQNRLFAGIASSAPVAIRALEAPSTHTPLVAKMAIVATKTAFLKLLDLNIISPFKKNQKLKVKIKITESRLAGMISIILHFDFYILIFL